MFRVLYAQHYRFVYRIAFAIALDDHEAHDIAQDVFMRFHDHLNEVEAPAVHTWLRRVAVRKAISSRRRFAAWFRRELHVESSPRGPESAASRNEVVAKLRVCLSQIGSHQRALLALHFDEDLPPSEIAIIIGSTANATRVALHRALRALRIVALDQGLEFPEEDFPTTSLAHDAMDQTEA